MWFYVFLRRIGKNGVSLKLFFRRAKDLLGKDREAE
jgi:hypothetical protein